MLSGWIWFVATLSKIGFCNALVNHRDINNIIYTNTFPFIRMDQYDNNLKPILDSIEVAGKYYSQNIIKILSLLFIS